MDETNMPSGSRSGPWTNEKHMHFLNSIEASFVHTMFENNDHLLRLDRYLPDTSDSTLDLKTQRRKRQVTRVNHIAGPRAGLDNRSDRRTRPHRSQDQVVPQLGNRSDNKDESHPSNSHVAPAN